MQHRSRLGAGTHGLVFAIPLVPAARALLPAPSSRQYRLQQIWK